jgi:uncharacterized protein
VARKIESPVIRGPAGRLEALLEEPEDSDPRFAALVCHPHPQHGGTMHNKAVYRIARGLRTGGAVALRFNYRGVNLSDGAYDNGIGEIDDARACLRFLRERYPTLPYMLAGFSFGARIVLKLGCSDVQAECILAAGFPVLYLKEDSFLDCAPARYFVQSTHDQYCPRAELEPFVERLQSRATAVWIESDDHFFNGGLEELEKSVIQIANSIA